MEHYVFCRQTQQCQANTILAGSFLMRTFVAPHAANTNFLSLNSPLNSFRILLLFLTNFIQTQTNYINRVRTSLIQSYSQEYRIECKNRISKTSSLVSAGSASHNLRLCIRSSIKIMSKGELFTAQKLRFPLCRKMLN